MKQTRLYMKMIDLGDRNAAIKNEYIVKCRNAKIPIHFT